MKKKIYSEENSFLDYIASHPTGMNTKKVHIGHNSTKDYLAIHLSGLSIKNIMTFEKGLTKYLNYYKKNNCECDESWHKGYFTGYAYRNSTIVLESQCELVTIKIKRRWKTFILNTNTMQAYDFIVEKGEGYYILNNIYELLESIE